MTPATWISDNPATVDQQIRVVAGRPAVVHGVLLATVGVSSPGSGATIENEGLDRSDPTSGRTGAPADERWRRRRMEVMLQSTGHALDLVLVSASLSDTRRIDETAAATWDRPPPGLPVPDDRLTRILARLAPTASAEDSAGTARPCGRRAGSRRGIMLMVGKAVGLHHRKGECAIEESAVHPRRGAVRRRLPARASRPRAGPRDAQRSALAGVRAVGRRRWGPSGLRVPISVGAASARSTSIGTARGPSPPNSTPTRRSSPPSPAGR